MDEEYYFEDDDIPADLDLPDDDAPRGLTSSGKATPAQQGRITPAGWKPTPKQPIPVIRCTATVRHGPNEGQRCTKWSVRGTNVCLSHGGNLPNVKEAAQKAVEAARLRLLGEADSAIDTLLDLMENSTMDNIKLNAAKEVLDRAGVKGAVEFHVEVEQKASPADAIRDRLASIAKRLDAGPVDLGEIIPGETVEESTNPEQESE